MSKTPKLTPPGFTSADTSYVAAKQVPFLPRPDSLIFGKMTPAQLQALPKQGRSTGTLTPNPPSESSAIFRGKSRRRRNRNKKTKRRSTRK